MSAAILLRIAPALATAVVVAWAATRDRDTTLNVAVDQVLRGAVVALVAGRLGWMLLGGPLVWRRAASTFFLVRSGVETMLGVLVAILWISWRSDVDERAWMLRAAPAAALAGTSVWHGLCGVEDVCAGVPADWGVRLQGFAGPVAPVGYIEAAVALALAVVAFVFRDRVGVALGAAVTYAVARAGLGFLRAPLVTLPTRDQILSLAVGVALAGIGVLVTRRRAVDQAVA